ncbi:MAG: carboxylating nicotinate-nucleotide diphosphorylase [Novosphingobium pentaromativorans]|uniref:Probable nicotinate-nucleotide pyrophosphorylase [carboxylating] n=1 Tax=Novosphingobium pentaromativorans TaxID=205844 RepID=A0A2W5NKC6_9SPHN|nr:MAG: carboxylating nicotinate-nucleotide diphosphorylase [Novosphingobium pentaromativorans]
MSTFAIPGFDLPGFDLAAFVDATLAEDLGVGLPGGGRDVTSESVIEADARFSGVMDSRDAVTVAGLPIAAAFFRKLDPAMEIEILVEEGARVEPGTKLMRLTGNARAMLTGERSALNTVQHLTGIATMTREYVDAMKGDLKTGGATLLDTRKTIPGLRHLEKYATRTGGARNHRMGLWDAAMIKDNHVLVAGGVGPAVARARAAGVAQIICEVDRLDQIEPAIAAGAHHLLLDNMGPDMLREAVALVAGRVPTEASGGVNLSTIGAIAASGVTYVSVGRLTQSAPAADIGLDFTPL